MREEDQNLNYGRHILQEWLSTIKPSSVLDVGVGHGADIETVRSKFPEASCFGIESNKYYADYARQQNIAISEINIERSLFPYDDEFFDLIIANQVFEHMKDIFWCLDQISRTLKQGGYFYFGVPNLASLHNRILLLMGKQPTCIRNSSPHVRGFTPDDVIETFNACWPNGYEVIAFQGSNFYPLPPSLAKPLAKVAPSLSVSIFYLLKKKRTYCGEFVKYPIDMETNFYLGQEINHKI